MRSSSVRCSDTAAGTSVPSPEPFPSPSGEHLPFRVRRALRDPRGAPARRPRRAGIAAVWPPRASRALPVEGYPRARGALRVGSGSRGCAGGCAAPGCGPRSSCSRSLDGVADRAAPAVRGRAARRGRRRCCSRASRTCSWSRCSRRSSGALLRRRRPDLPRVDRHRLRRHRAAARVSPALLAAGLVHRPGGRRPSSDDARRGARRGRAATSTSQAPEWRPGLARSTRCASRADVYRACVPGRDRGAALCLFVDTDQRPAGRARATTRWSRTARCAPSAGSTEPAPF